MQKSSDVLVPFSVWICCVCLTSQSFTLITKPMSILKWVFHGVFIILPVTSPGVEPIQFYSCLCDNLFSFSQQQDSTELSYLHFFISPPCFHALIVSPSVRIRPGSVSGCSENGNAKCCFCGPNVGLFLLSEVRGMNSRWIRKLTVAGWMGTCFVRDKYLF